MKKNTHIYLIGLSGTGKYTIAKELSKHGYKIVDNHLVNNPIFSLLELDGIRPIPISAWAAIEKIRNIIFRFLENLPGNFVFTNELLNDSSDAKLYKKVLKLSANKNAIFIPVRLSISEEERTKRISNPERKLRFKATHDNRYGHEVLKIKHSNLLELDITNLNAIEATNKIIAHISKKI